MTMLVRLEVGEGGGEGGEGEGGQGAGEVNMDGGQRNSHSKLYKRGSILMTSAPKYPRTLPVKGPAIS